MKGRSSNYRHTQDLRTQERGAKGTVPLFVLGIYNLSMLPLSTPFLSEIRTSYSCASPSDFWKAILRKIESLLLLT